ncbi:MAG: hypothetical protein RLZ11_1329, partial [Bacteroidota bacterium]
IRAFQMYACVVLEEKKESRPRGNGLRQLLAQ